MFVKTSEAKAYSLSFLVTGKPGAGKTTLTKTLPLDQVLYVNIENGYRSISDSNILMYDVTVDQNGNSLPRAMRHKKLIHFFTEVVVKPELKSKIKYIVFDSLSEASSNLIEMLKEQFPDRKDALVMYGENNAHITDLIKRIRDLPFTTLVVALDAVEKDDLGRRFHGTDVVGKVSQRLPAFFDEVLYLDNFEIDGKEERLLLTNNYQNYIAKDRSGKLSLFEQPDMSLIINKILGGKNA